MSDVTGPVILGILLCLLGVSNMRGNIASVHWYHRRRISPENIKPFGRLVGLGTLVIGIALAAFGLLNSAAERLQNEAFAIVGTALLSIAAVVGIGGSIFAMLKYNKGIF